MLDQSLSGPGEESYRLDQPCPGTGTNRLDRFAMHKYSPSRLSPNIRAIMSPARTAQRDRAPDVLAAGTPPKLRDDLVALLGADRVLTRPIDLVRYATDASPYRLFPKVVVIARNVDDVRKVLEYARQEA